jgi:hypothetical protein
MLTVKNIKRVVASNTLILVALFSGAQYITSCFLGNLPQTTLVNPAMQPKCYFFLGGSFLSRFDMAMSNNDLSFNFILFL